MTLLDQYLKAVAAQLPKDARDDIVAELRDMILTRFEAKEEELGRPLTDGEQEAILREVGHPLAVAGRYHTGANHLIGPELYPYFLFAVKIGLAALIVITLLASAIQVLVGELSLSEGIGHAFSNIVSGGITLIGFAAIAGFIIERQPEKPKFLREWRVKDLHLFEFAAFDTEALERSFKEGQKGKSMSVTMGFKSSSPAANALGAAMGLTVLLLWWTGVLPIADLRPGAGSWVMDGIDYGAILTSIVEVAFWPILAYLAARIGLELFRAWRPGARRVAALGQLTLALVRLGGLLWLWSYSPLSPVIHVDSMQALIDGARRMADGHFSLATLLTLIGLFMMIETVGNILGSAWRLATPARAETAKA
ncbi:hypothetical protein [Caulobacter sp. NIBR1757]|uniref:HAAS signaling domain-containing protein n=1 Tax=Caulobacter sp. NIBR1757 TaxID=3016000 RepID=UPI0022F01B0C|nr:hypothetical protein [Caulobacter sp. NIBR1757]WGM40707.1 hypothetical protein AMEJIAPC_03654 [Caulobacter sp. NIBR1757]